jgi:hypothetical protein
MTKPYLVETKPMSKAKPSPGTLLTVRPAPLHGWKLQDQGETVAVFSNEADMVRWAWLYGYGLVIGREE